MAEPSKNRKFFRIAIDGPVAAGKGTVARILAERLRWLYVDTGAMYRTAALLALRAGIPLDDAQAVAALVRDTTIIMHNPVAAERDGRLTTIKVNDEDISWKIRTEAASRGASLVATHTEVRKALVRKQQDIAASQNVVMEGRDITFRVLPDADLKIYLTATVAERARRRHLQLMQRGEDVSLRKVLTELRKRDARDTSRTVDPLQVVPGAWKLDTTDLEINDVVEKILKRIRRMRDSSYPSTRKTRTLVRG